MTSNLTRRGLAMTTACCLLVAQLGCATHSATRMARSNAQSIRSSAPSLMATAPQRVTGSGSTVKPAAYSPGVAAPGSGLPLGDLNSLSRRSSCHS